MKQSIKLEFITPPPGGLDKLRKKIIDQEFDSFMPIHVLLAVSFFLFVALFTSTFPVEESHPLEGQFTKEMAKHMIFSDKHDKKTKELVSKNTNQMMVPVLSNSNIAYYKVVSLKNKSE